MASDGKPKQSDLRRAVSTAYYALFHCLARCCADAVTGTTKHSKPAWRQVFRALDHGHAKGQCEKANGMNFPVEIKSFAVVFRTMQTKRHEADYDPYKKFFKSAVRADVVGARRVIQDFAKASTKDRRAFAALVLLKDRKL